MAQDEKRLLYSPKSAARALDVSVSAIYAMMRRGELHFVSVLDGRKIPGSEIERIVQHGTASATADAGTK